MDRAQAVAGDLILVSTTEEFIMSNLQLFEPRIFDPVLVDPFELMSSRFMAPMRKLMEDGSLDIRIDVAEADGMYKVHADIPGVKKDDINVQIDGNVVRIDAQ